MDVSSFAQELQTNVFLTRGEVFQGSITKRRAFIALSDKRLYTRYKTFISTREQSVDLRDVTGIWYTYVKPLVLLILGIIFLVGGVAAMIATEETATISIAVVGLLLLLFYFLGRRTLLQVEYPGGRINYIVTGSSNDVVRDFISRTRYFKDQQINRR